MESETTEPADFARTRWSLVRRAAAADEREARAALEELCRAYWRPLYAFARRKGLDAHACEDVVQGLLAELIERRDLDHVRAEKGRFRSFLLAAMTHYIANRGAHERAEKRGGGWRAIAIDAADADQRLGLAARDDDSPERAFERAWARELMDGAVTELEREYAASGRRAVFEALKGVLQGEGYDPARAAEALGIAEGAVKVAVHRLRARLAARVRARIAQTVSSADEVESELGDLLRALRE